MSTGVPELSAIRVLAIVLTYNSSESLVQCAAAIRSQLAADDGLLIVDNASQVAASTLIEAEPHIWHLRLPENLGPAGGYARGLEWFLQSRAQHVWLVDDDMKMPAGALAGLMTELEKQPVHNGVWPRIRRPNGDLTCWPAWAGALLRREAISNLGLPREDFFWWAEDSEYFQWRLQKRGGASVFVPSIIVEHSEVRRGHFKPKWKFYYEVRNIIYYRLHLQIRHGGWSKPKMVRRMVVSITRQVGRVVLQEDQKGPKLAAIAVGVADGLRGKLGRRPEMMQ